MSDEFIAGLVIGALIASALGAIASWLLVRRSERKKADACPHDKVLVHTIGTKRLSGDVAAVGMCEACSEEVRYELGHVAEDAVIDVLDIRLTAKGYTRHPQPRGGGNVIYQRRSL